MSPTRGCGRSITPTSASRPCEALIAARGSHAAARPIVDGRGGHPPLIARALFAQLARCESEPEGARSVLARADTIDVVVADLGAIRDVDTREELAL